MTSLSRDTAQTGLRPSWAGPFLARLQPIALAALSLGAAGIHFGVIREHVAESVLFGLFFSGVGWFETIWAVAYVVRPARLLAVVGIVGSVATVAVWVWAHLIGLPFGPDAGALEPTTITDVTATSFEILLATWLMATLMLRGTTRRTSAVVGVALVSALVILIAIATTAALSVPMPAG